MKKTLIAIGVAILPFTTNAFTKAEFLEARENIEYASELPVIPAPRCTGTLAFQGGCTMGTYDVDRVRITLDNQISRQMLYDVLSHEVGHYVFNKKFTSVRQRAFCREFNKTSKNQSKFLRNYSNPWEQCNEAFSIMYQLRKYGVWKGIETDSRLIRFVDSI